MLLEVGIYRGSCPGQNDGWHILCEQEKMPHRTTEEPDCPILLCEGETPSWLGEYLAAGGVAVITGATAGQLPFSCEDIGDASLEYADLTALGAGRARIQSVVHVFGGDGLGTLALHENRNIKLNMHPDEYPAVLWKSVGAGGCWYTGIPFAELICSMGDTLRAVNSYSNFTERVTSVDKYLLLRAMRTMVKKAFFHRGMPYVFLNYYPGDYHSVFAFRVDIDGVFGDCLEKLSAAARDSGIRASFYVNKDLCKAEKEALKRIDPMHDLGCHGVVHNLYTAEEDNYENIRNCRVWMEKLGLPQGDGFVAPRGMWNFALNRALERNEISYTSDFGYCIYGLPFYPYYRGSRMAVKQIPVDPFSVERAFVQAEEEGQAVPDAAFVADYFCRTAQEQYALGMPIILYSHPQHFGALAEQVFPCLYKKLKEFNIWHATMGEFNAWWTLRDSAQYQVDWRPGSGELTVLGSLPQGIRICREE